MAPKSAENDTTTATAPTRGFPVGSPADNPVAMRGRDQLVTQPDVVERVLSDTSKTLLEVAQELDIVTADNKDEAEILRTMDPAQQAEIRTAVLDAIRAQRPVEYVCAITDPAAVVRAHPGSETKVQVHVDQTSKDTKVKVDPAP